VHTDKQNIRKTPYSQVVLLYFFKLIEINIYSKQSKKYKAFGIFFTNNPALIAEKIFRRAS